MDHKAAYAHHIAQAIRHKKALAKEPKEEGVSEDLDLEADESLEVEDEAPADPKAARKERLKAILAR